MKIRLGLIAWAAGALVLAAVSGCGDTKADPSPTPTVTSPPPTTPASDTTSPSPTSPSDQAGADASATIRKYYAVLDELGTDPDSDLAKLDTVATSTQLSAMKRLLRTQHRQRQHQTGALAVADLIVQSVNLDNSDPAAGKVPAVVVDVCWDVSKVDVLDASGKSIISPGRPDIGWTRFTVANYHYAADPSGGWRVATGQDLEQAPCAAS